MIYHCYNCGDFGSYGEHQFAFELTCGRCHCKICGKCHSAPHYPATCAEVLRFANRNLEIDLDLTQSIQEYLDWHEHVNWVFDWLNFRQSQYEQFGPEGIERFNKRLKAPFKQMWEVVGFWRSYNLHTIYNQLLGVFLGDSHDLFVARMEAFVNSVPLPGVPTELWRESLGLIRMTSIDVGTSVMQLIKEIPQVESLVRELHPSLAISEVLEQEEIQNAEKAVLLWMTKVTP